MNSLRIATQQQRKSFRPGDQVCGAAGWELEEQPKAAEVRLFWYTAGNGTRDAQVVAQQAFEAPKSNDERSFQFTLPEAPYSFSGKLISLIWAVELVIQPGDQAERVEITVSPTGEEMVLSESGNEAPASAAHASA